MTIYSCVHRPIKTNINKKAGNCRLPNFPPKSATSPHIIPMLQMRIYRRIPYIDRLLAFVTHRRLVILLRLRWDNHATRYQTKQSQCRSIFDYRHFDLRKN